MILFRSLVRHWFRGRESKTRPVTEGSVGHTGRCSFCGKTYPDISILVVSPQAGICDACIQMCQTIATEELGQEP